MALLWHLGSKHVYSFPGYGHYMWTFRQDFSTLMHCSELCHLGACFVWCAFLTAGGASKAEGASHRHLQAKAASTACPYIRDCSQYLVLDRTPLITFGSTPYNTCIGFQ